MNYIPYFPPLPGYDYTYNKLMRNVVYNSTDYLFT